MSSGARYGLERSNTLTLNPIAKTTGSLKDAVLNCR